MTNNADFVNAETKNINYQKQSRKKLGSYYTPQNLANLIAWESLNAWFTKQWRGQKQPDSFSESEKKHLLKQIKHIRILDPSVGDGAFLISAADWLDRVQINLGDRRPLKKRKRQIVETSLYGVDISSEATESCRKRLIEWSVGNEEDFVLGQHLADKISQGNSLIGPTRNNGSNRQYKSSFNWSEKYPDVMGRPNPGFDIVLGNPPYGNILSYEERECIESEYPFMVGKNRNGTWNSAAHFMVRSKMLLRKGGELALLIPNSILRVNQFSKTRNFLLDELRLWKIVDEGSPFDDVMLEMVTIFCEAMEPKDYDSINIESRRPNYEQDNTVPRSLLKTCKVFPIYHDDLYSQLLQKGKRNFMTASRGRDIPKSHVKRKSTSNHSIPYITSGRSVRRYHIDEKYQVYTDSWFMNDQRLKKSFETELLVATKNFKYPRCIVKPKGVVHGGGIVEIKPHSDEVNKRALGLILNSHLIQYVCTRYLTNYSQLTTCLNTGILEDLPIIEPKYPDAYEILFDTLSTLHSDLKQNEDCRQFLECLSNALVYDLYFGSNDFFQERIATLVEIFSKDAHPRSLCRALRTESIISSIKSIRKIPDFQIIEKELGSES
ncbi:hypothetical protein EU527_01255 [Candidatus Thorarchaeota archaeon]|nr:MAG: hypothetical protein EU527_01255 [Candidatus Thorarchaeota archaeon]